MDFNELYLPCACGDPHHGLFLRYTEYWGTEWEVGISVHAQRDSLWQRIRAAWWILTGHDTQCELVLNWPQLAELRRFTCEAWDQYAAQVHGTPAAIADGFGSTWPAACPNCGAPMQVVRPGDARCSAVCEEV